MYAENQADYISKRHRLIDSATQLLQMKRFVLLFVVALSSFSSSGFAAKLRNVIQQQDSAESMQTQRVCNALRVYPRRLLCLPLPYSPLKTAGMSFNTMVKAKR